MDRKKFLTVSALMLIALTAVSCDLAAKNPYLIYTGSNSEMRIQWQLRKTASCLLEWGDTPACGHGRIATEESRGGKRRHIHSPVIRDLSPGKKYYYRVTMEGRQSSGSFFTAPAAGGSNLKFVAYGDTRTNPQQHDILAGEILKLWSRDEGYRTFILATGDLTFDGNIELNWTREFFNGRYANIRDVLAGAPLISCWGNHEGFGRLFAEYFPFPYVDNSYWAFDYGPAHFVMLDQNSSYRPGSAQYAWLVKDLSGTGKRWKFIALHEPGWSAGSTDPFRGHGNNRDVQRYIQPLCRDYGVDIVFCGHNHYYARAEVDGVKHLTLGGGGAPLYPPDPGKDRIVTVSESFHYSTVEISGGRLVFTAIEPGGAEIDRFVINK